MKKNLKLALSLILILVLNVALLGCDKQSLDKHDQQDVDKNIVFDAELKDEKVIKIEEYIGCVFALTESGKVFCWGLNRDGALGIGVSEEEKDLFLEPIQMPIPEVVIQISAGYLYSMALTENGEIYVWGINSSRNSYVGDIAAKIELVKITSEVHFTDISVSGSHCLALTDSGEIYSWGLNVNGQLGDGLRKDREYLAKVPMPEEIISVEAGNLSSYALGISGKVFSWGSNQYGQLGHGDIGIDVLNPILVELPEKVKKIAAGAVTAMAITENGKLYSWGNNKFGALGVGSFENQGVPVLVDMPEKVEKIYTKFEHVIAFTEKENIYVWGKNDIGQLGLGHLEETNKPSLLVIDGKVESISVGSASNFIKIKDIGYYGFGGNVSWQLYVGDNEHKNTPVKTFIK